jgi:tRNA G46 methylase TrmB
VLQYPEGMKGKWNEFFKNNNPMILELACGKGEVRSWAWSIVSSKKFYR